MDGDGVAAAPPASDADSAARRTTLAVVGGDVEAAVQPVAADDDGDGDAFPPTATLCRRARALWAIFPQPSNKTRLLLLVLVVILATASVTISSGDAFVLLGHVVSWLDDELSLGGLIALLVLANSLLCAAAVPNALLATTTALLYSRRLPLEGALPLGLCSSLLALCVGGSISYALGVTLLKEWAEKFASNSPTVAALRLAMVKDGAKVSALLRTSLPASMVNYGMAAAGCDFGTFVIGFAGHVPWTFLYTWVGCSIEELSELNSADDDGVNDAKLWGTIAAVTGTAVVLTWVGATSVRRLVKAQLDAQSVADGGGGGGGGDTGHVGAGGVLTGTPGGHEVELT